MLKCPLADPSLPIVVTLAKFIQQLQCLLHPAPYPFFPSLTMPLGTSSAVPRQKLTILAFLILNLVALSTLWSLSIPRPSQGIVSFDDALAQSTALAPIVFALVMFGKSSATEGAIAIKSALMYASRPVDLHIITSEDAIPVLEEKFQLVKRAAYPVRVFYYPLDAASIRKRASRAGVETRYEAGVGAYSSSDFQASFKL